MEPLVSMMHKRKFIYWIFSMTAIGVLTIILTLTIFVFAHKTIYPVIYIDTIDVSNLTKEEARQKIEDVLENELERLEIKLRYEDQYWKWTYKDIGYEYLYDEAVEKAYSIGRRGNIFERFKEIYHAKNNVVIIPLEYQYDLKNLDQILFALQGTINKEPVDAQITRENHVFLIQDETMGVRLNQEELKARIIDRVENLSMEEIIIPIQYVIPRITKEKLQNIQNVLGEYSTVFDAKQIGRSANISIASNSINGVLVMPGEEFSFNKQTGPRGVTEGYQEAPIILNGELIPGIGGGICQVSTTLYNAVVRADLEVTQRQNHSLPVAYVPLGHDATVSYGYIDLKFVNSSSYPIFVESYVNKDRVTVKIYGKKTENEAISLLSETVQVIEPKIEIIKNPEMYVGERIVEKEAHKGYRVNTYKIYKKNGKEVLRELISQDYYHPVHGVIVEGTKPLPEVTAEGGIEDRNSN